MGQIRRIRHTLFGTDHNIPDLPGNGCVPLVDQGHRIEDAFNVIHCMGNRIVVLLVELPVRINGNLRKEEVPGRWAVEVVVAFNVMKR